jgi:signal transduction histidine kinase
MPGLCNRVGLAEALIFALCLAGGRPQRSLAQTSDPSTTAPSEATAITNLAQLCRAFGSQERFYSDLRLELVVCASSRPEIGVVVARDDTGVELLELGRRGGELPPGEKIRIEGNQLLLRRRELGTQISAAPLVDDDGLHRPKTVAGEIVLKAGPVPVELDWFNCFRNFALEVACQQPNRPRKKIPDSALWHVTRDHSPGATNLAGGLRVECFEGYWEQVPDFDLLRKIKSGTTRNFDLGFRTQDELAGLRYTGFFEAPSDGRYTFQVTSDDGSLLFIGPAQVPVSRLGAGTPLAAQPGLIGQAMHELEERRWMSLAGRVSFVSKRGAGLELELRSGADTLSVTVADAAGLEPPALLNGSVRVAGVGRAALAAGRRIVLDRLYVASGTDLKQVPAETDSAPRPAPLMDIGQVQTIQIREAKRELPVRVRGVVTAANRSDWWLALQDDTRGIFVDLHGVSNAFPARADLCEVIGHTAPGNFAPIVVAEKLERLGRGRLPPPARPSWNELANGSMDVQWVEFQGLVSEVHSNMLCLVLPEGSLQVRLESHFETELSQYQHAVVRIRGTLFAIWNADTREVQFGSLLMRDASVNVDTPPPSDPFNAPIKTARDLLLFDARATAFRPVKVRAQVLYADAQHLFAADQGLGLRVLAAEAAELQPGDFIEAVGYPEISGPSPLLRQALVRKTGTGPLPRPIALAGPDLARKGLDSTLVRVEAKLMAMHAEQNSTVLELESNRQLFVARIKADPTTQPLLRLGSKLQLCGVLCESGRTPRTGSQVESFELLLNSPTGILVLSQPSWWTLGRLAAVVGILLVILVLAAAWINQLRRQVEQRTAQLQREIRERERAERHQALEAERSRIARDLHDDLGSSLTEIGAMASTGQRGNGVPGGSPKLFDAIVAKARDSIAALDVIVWAVDPEDNWLQSLADYLSGFAGEYLASSNVACRFKIPVALPAIMFEGRVRHDLFLAVKETLNNVVQHAQASEVEFGIAVTAGALEIVIADNGTGFDSRAESGGNGLKNLRDRLAKLGGSCAVESQVGSGTTVRIRLALPVAEAPGL